MLMGGVVSGGTKVGAMVKVAGGRWRKLWQPTVVMALADGDGGSGSSQLGQWRHLIGVKVTADRGKGC